MTFVHLHVHSHFSLLDGLSPVEGYVKRAADFGQPAIAITDHGSLSGLYRLWKAARVEGVKPIAGCEFYIALEGRHDKKRADGYSGSGAYGHITVLAKDVEGVRNLYRLQAEAYRTGFYRKPRIDMELLAEHREGLIILTGCPSGVLATRILQGDEKGARTHLHELKDIFGEDLYAEVMYHGIEEDDLNDRWLANEIATLAAGAAVPTVVTGDAHYVSESDSGTHSALLCLQTHSTLDDPNRFKFNGSGYHLLSAKEVERVLHATGVSKAAAARTLEIAE